MTEDKTEAVAILGAGAWGLSTALHLTEAGYTHVTVFDQASEIPSTFSGAYDLNKIVRAEYEDEFYTELALVSKPICEIANHFASLACKTVTHIELRKPSITGRHHSGVPIFTNSAMSSPHQAPRLQKHATTCKQRSVR